MRYKKIIFILSATIVIIFSGSCSNKTSTETIAGQKFCIPDSLLKNVTFDTLRLSPEISELTLSGKITFNEDNVAKIFPLVSGHVSEVKVSLGDYVEKGQVLALIRSSDMAGYFNDYRTSQSELAIANKNLEVISSMQSSGVSSEKDVLVARNEYQKALSQFNKMREVLKINGSSFSINDSIGSGYMIKAPISGFIAEKNINNGMDIRPDANDNLFTISDLRKVWAIANVYETDIPKIKSGNLAEVTTLSYPDKKLQGKVTRISNILDPDTKVMSVKILLENKDFSLKPGMFAHISIRISEHSKMLTIKSSSIIYEANKTYLLKFRGKCNVTEQLVNVVNTLDNRSFVKCDSLEENDIVIASNGLFIFTAINNL